MIYTLMYSPVKKELSMFKAAGADAVGRLSDEDWEFQGIEDSARLSAYLEKDPVIHIACVDVAAESGIMAAEQLRKSNKEMFIIILSDPGISPMIYIRPTILAGSLLLRPLDPKRVRDTMAEALRDYLRRLGSGESTGSFQVYTGEGRLLLPLRQILYFESRNKTIYVNTGVREYSFYDTLDHIGEQLGESFVRCHRSFLVAKNRIKKVRLSENTIVLDSDYEIPLSRSCKTAVKELK